MATKNALPCADDPDRQYPHPSKHYDVWAAKKICLPCPRRGACLRAALDADARNGAHGVWAGFSAAEREHLVRGSSPKPCARCKVPFVPPPGSRADRCPIGACQRGIVRPPTRRAPPVQVAKEDPETARIVRLAQQGLTDAQISEEVGLSVRQVQRRRSAAGVQPGYRSRVRGPLRPEVVDRCEAGEVTFGELRMAERVELWRRWSAAGRGAHDFTRRYSIAWRVLRELRAAAAAADQPNQTSVALAA